MILLINLLKAAQLLGFSPLDSLAKQSKILHRFLSLAHKLSLFIKKICTIFPHSLYLHLKTIHDQAYQKE